MKLVFISDTHNWLDYIKIPDGDILVHSGDMTKAGTEKELRKFNDDIKVLPHKHKLVIAGNHDKICQTDPGLAKTILKDCTWLNDEAITIDGINFYGAPWTPEFGMWSFMLPRGPDLARKWSFIPDDTHVLITHGPPHGILDMVDNIIHKENTGCEMLAERIKTLPALKIHAFGHIHEQYGHTFKDGVLYINAASLNDRYVPANAPFEVETDE